MEEIDFIRQYIILAYTISFTPLFAMYALFDYVATMLVFAFDKKGREAWSDYQLAKQRLKLDYKERRRQERKNRHDI